MVNTPFEQITHIPQNIRESLLATCQLVVFLQSSRVYYLLIAPSGEIVLCRECINSRRFSQEMFLRFVLEKDKLLSTPFLSCRIYTSSHLFTFFPGDLWETREKGLIARASLSDQMDDKEIFIHESKTLNSQLICFLPPGIPHLLDRYIRHYSLSHIGMLMAETTVIACPNEVMISALVMDDYILISAVKKNQLLLCNSYHHHSPSDMVYFIQTVREVTGLVQNNVPIYVMGELGEKITREGGLWEYLPDLNVPDTDSPFYAPGIAESQWWKFSFLANITKPS
ncbi:MAG: DUF3822 family protein [Bacteroidia bacterium]|nr:DUF3822 family protein [Bacteroidia bacterium]